MKKYLFIVLVLFAFGGLMNVSATLPTPIPDEWTLKIANEKLVTSSMSGDQTAWANEPTSTHEGFVVNTAGGGVNYKIRIKRSLGGSGVTTIAGGYHTYYDSTYLVEFNNNDFCRVDFDVTESCSISSYDCVQQGYDYQVHVDENNIFKKLTTYVTLFFEDLD